MPIYAYKCDACGHAKDVLQKMSDAPLTVCPQCGAASFKKQLTAAGFQLKGSGWYVTDFKGGAPSGAPPGQGAEGGSNSTQTPTPEATPASAPTPSPAPAAAPASAPTTPKAGA